MMKVLETWFGGICFRSRTEARWAVFFKACDIRYEYEKEGYDLGGGVWYLPDFWLPDLGRWFEVKGKRPAQDELEKCRALAVESDSEVLLAVGLPDPNTEQIIRVYPSFDFFLQDGDWYNHRLQNWQATWSPTREYEAGWQFADDHLKEGIFWLDSGEFGAVCLGPNEKHSADSIPRIAHSATARGFDASRRERFGH